MGAASRNGFAIIADHGIPDALIHDAEEKARAFFALPEDEAQVPYLGRRRSARLHAVRDRDAAKGASAFDLKEFWHVGRQLAHDHPFRDHMPDNVLAVRGRGLPDTFEELFATFDRTGLKILKAIARFLKIDEDYFVDTAGDGNW